MGDLLCTISTSSYIPAVFQQKSRHNFRLNTHVRSFSLRAKPFLLVRSFPEASSRETKIISRKLEKTKQFISFRIIVRFTVLADLVAGCPRALDAMESGNFLLCGWPR